MLVAEAPLGIRPEGDLALYLHVAGAMVLVGALVCAAYFLFTARRDGSLDGVRLGWRTLLLCALPAYLVMRVAAQWILSEENLDDAEFAWIDIGFIVTDVGLLVLIVALVASGMAVRRANRAEAGTAAPAQGAPATGRAVSVAAWATSLLIVAYVVAIWAMTTKPV